MKKFSTSNMGMKVGTCLASLAFIVASNSIGTMCYFIFNQPKMPDNIREFKR